MSRRRLGGGLGMLRGGRVSVGMQLFFASRVRSVVRRSRSVCCAAAERVKLWPRHAAMDAERDMYLRRAAVPVRTFFCQI